MVSQKLNNLSNPNNYSIKKGKKNPKHLSHRLLIEDVWIPKVK